MVKFLDIELDNQTLTDFQKFVSERLPFIVDESIYFGLKRSALFIKSEARKFIKSDGDGTFIKRSKIATDFTSSASVTFRKKRNKKLDTGLSFLMKYFDWKIEEDRSGKTVLIDFRESSRDEIEFLIHQVQLGDEITVTDKMRNAFSYTDYPLKDSTKSIKIPAREIQKPLFRKVQNNVFPVFTRFFFEQYKRLKN